MKTDFKIILAAGFFLSAITVAIGGSSTISVKDGGGTSRTYDVITDGSGNYVAETGMCDGTAAAHCAAVDSSGGVSVAGEGTAGSAAGGVLSVQGVASGTALPVSAASLPLPTGAATSANQSTEITSLSTIATNTGAATPAGTNLIGNTGQLYPAGSTPITASATGTTSATTATLAASASIHTYICGFSIRANATAAVTNNATVTGTVTGTLNFTQWTAPLASGLGVTEEVFSPCIISSAVNTGVAVVSGAPGSGGVVSVTAWGYQL